MIRLDNLTKSFRGRPALTGLNLEVPRGAMYGLLGHNGAGKSTTFGLILGHLFPDAGDAWIRGTSVRQNRHAALQGVGAIFETPGFYDYLSGWRNLRILASYSGRTDQTELEEAVRLVGLESRIHDPVRVYSHGMRQRLALAQALVPRPEVVLLDEPTEGLDPEGIHEIRNLILRLNREQGMTVLLSSHLLAEVEILCERVAILNQSRLVFDGDWVSLRGNRLQVRLELSDWTAAAPVLDRCGAHAAGEGMVELTAGTDVADLVEALVQGGVRVRAVEPVRRNLEQLYLETVGSA